MPDPLVSCLMRLTTTLLLGGLLCLGGCATPGRPHSANPISVSEVPYTISPLDEVVIQMPDGNRETLTVSHEGPIETADGRIPAVGQSRDALVARLRKIYPSATIEVQEFRANRVTVLGEVFHQIHTDLGDGPMRVMDAIASANGFTPIANKRRVRLLRQNAGSIKVYELDLREMMLGQDLDRNLLLQPGDIITVPRNFL